MSSFKKICPAKGLCGRCLSEFIDWRYSQSRWNFRPSFVNCCHSLLLSCSTLPPLLPYVNKNFFFRILGGGVCGSGPQTDKILPQSPFTCQFFRWRHYALPMGLIFLQCTWTRENGLLVCILQNMAPKRRNPGLLYNKSSHFTTCVLHNAITCIMYSLLVCGRLQCLFCHLYNTVQYIICHQWPACIWYMVYS